MARVARHLACEKPKRRRYYVETWDPEKEQFSPQPGVRTGPYSLFGLRQAIRKLRRMGYSCDYCSLVGIRGRGDPSVLIFTIDGWDEVQP